MNWSSWLDNFDKSRGECDFIASRLRSGGGASVGINLRQLQTSVQELQQQFTRLRNNSKSGEILDGELHRRKQLLDKLAKDQMALLEKFNQRSTFRPGTSRDGNSKLLGMQKQIMKDQDSQLDEISKGVSNLRQYSMAVKDESELHVKLLEDINNDVSSATTGLENEGNRAQTVSKNSSNFKLYLTILILVVILIFLLLAGGS